MGFGFSQLIFAWVVFQSVRQKGKVASQAVWEDPKGLEWTVPSPAPYHTFDTPPKLSTGVAFPEKG
jgi:cytochrome c oxidase subunit 1